MTSDATPSPVPVPPEDEPAQIFPSATGLVVPDERNDREGDLQSPPPDA